MLSTALRFFQVAWASLRWFLLPLLANGSHLPRPVRLRRWVEQLGGAYTKLGQSLALRFDVLQPAYCNELIKLSNEVERVPYDQVRAVLIKDGGDDPERVFASVDPIPLATASIGQVHAA